MSDAGTRDVFVLRPYEPADFEWLWQIDQQCFTRGIAYSKRELAHYIALRGAFTIVAEAATPLQKGRQPIAGFLVGRKLRKDMGHVVTIDVVPEARRSGLGSRLMETCEERLRDAGCHAMFLETAVDNEVALRFYKRLGYSVVKTIPRYYFGSVDAFLLAKRLSPA